MPFLNNLARKGRRPCCNQQHLIFFNQLKYDPVIQQFAETIAHLVRSLTHHKFPIFDSSDRLPIQITSGNLTWLASMTFRITTSIYLGKLQYFTNLNSSAMWG